MRRVSYIIYPYFLARVSLWLGYVGYVNFTDWLAFNLHTTMVRENKQIVII